MTDPARVGIGREMTLNEWVDILPTPHRAREDLDSINRELGEQEDEIERLREALQVIVDDHEFMEAHPDNRLGHADRGPAYAETARAALKDQP